MSISWATSVLAGLYALLASSGTLLDSESLNTIQRTLMQTSPAQLIQPEIEETQSNSFSDSFDDREGHLDENWPMQRSADSDWWVSSGAQLVFENGSARTLFGSLPSNSRWARTFKASNARDTDNGTRPQNIFRLVLRHAFQDATQEVYARMGYYHTSPSEYRNASNGILLFNRYQDEHTLYYAGIRVDGYAVIKKKLAGTYSTLGIVKVFPGEYDRERSPNLIPDQWMGIRSSVETTEPGVVTITLSLDTEDTGEWKDVLVVRDHGQYGAPITREGYGGIRTDFADVEFDDYYIASLQEN